MSAPDDVVIDSSIIMYYMYVNVRLYIRTIYKAVNVLYSRDISPNFITNIRI